MPSYERDKIERMLQKMFPHLWPSLTEQDIDSHRLECAALLMQIEEHPQPKELTRMVKRFKRTFV